MLLVVVRMIFINKNFPIVYSFVKSKTKIIFNFIFDSLKHWVFGNNIVEVCIILGNQIPDLIVSMPKSILNNKF